MAKYPKQMIWTIVVDIQTMKYLIFYIKIIIGVKITLTVIDIGMMIFQKVLLLKGVNL